MRRREIILCSAVLRSRGRSRRARSRPAVLRGSHPRLSSSEITSSPFEAFRKALHNFGYVEGKNISFVYMGRW